MEIVHIGLPQMILLTLIILDVGYSIALHGEERKGKYSLNWALFNAVLMILILRWGGFFNEPETSPIQHTAEESKRGELNRPEDLNAEPETKISTGKKAAEEYLESNQ